MKLFKFTFLLLTALLISQEQTKAGDFVDLQQQADLATANNYTLICNTEHIRNQIIGYLLHLYDINDPLMAGVNCEIYVDNNNVTFFFDQPQDYAYLLAHSIVFMGAAEIGHDQAEAVV